MSGKLITKFTEDELLSPDYALTRDQTDPLSPYRNEFSIPTYDPIKFSTKHGDNQAYNQTSSIHYFCGNSLGLMPKQIKTIMSEELDKWSTLGVDGHFSGERPWASIDDKPSELVVPIVGASCRSEVAIMNTLSTNLHLLMISFFNPKGNRTKILMEDNAFCSDNHIIRSQLALHNLSVHNDLILLKPRENETFLRTEDIIASIEQNASELALVMLPGIQFFTGQFFNMEEITAAGKRAGAIVGWDLAHAVGNVPLKLHDWCVDFAVWCHYKYCNSGPGAVGGAFVHKKHHNTPSLTEKVDPVDNSVNSTPENEEFQGEKIKRLEGWWGQLLNNRFRMGSDHLAMNGAGAWALSNPPVFGVLPVESSLSIMNKVGMDTLRTKSVQITAYLEALLKLHIVGKKNKNNILVTIITPDDFAQRGAQLSLRFDSNNSHEIEELLRERGVIVDKRRPNVIRISPAPLYNTYSDVFHCVRVLKDVLDLPELATQ